MDVGRWQTPFSNFDYPNHRGLMSVPPGDQITNKMQTPVKSVCIEAILLRCYYIIDQKCCQ